MTPILFMTLTELRYILAVAQEKHFGKAAAACFVTQPTLSLGVRKLEEELGAVLFERYNNGVKLTPFGEHIVAQAKRVIHETTVLKDLATHCKDPLKGVLRLGAIYTIGPYLFPYLIPALQKRAPEMPVAVQEDFTENFRDKLRNGEVDAVILALPFSEPHIQTWTLYDEPMVVLLPMHHPWQKKKHIAPTELAKEKVLLLGQGHCLRDQILQLCPACRTTIAENQYIGSSLETLRYMVLSGLGLTVLPLSAAQAENTKKMRNKHYIIREFTPPVPKRTIVLAWRKSFTRPQVIETLKQAISACPVGKFM